MRVGAAITSLQNPRFRAALALRDASERRRQGRLLVDGAREMGRAIDAGTVLREAWVAPERIRTEAARSAMATATRAGAQIVEVTPTLLGRLAYGDRDDGIVGVFEAPETGLARLTVPLEPFVGVLAGVEKPGNLGAILRSADGAGVDAIIVADPRCDPWNPNVIRASVGTVFRLPLATCSTTDAIAWIGERGLRIILARPVTGIDRSEADLRGPVAIVLGSEAEGLDAAWERPNVTAVSIPMLGLADSLNVSTTAAILFYEAQRQRRAS